MILYKYGTINKYSLSALNQKKIWMSKPENFNDPYELKFKKFDNDNISEIKGIEKIKAENPHIEDDESLIKQVLKHYQDEIQNYGVACFTEHNNNMLMWAHYANNHFGFCLGFESGDKPEINGFYKIDYTDDFPDINLEKIYHKDGLMKVLWTKSKAWKYEDEWRKINVDGSKLVPIEAELVEVVFGCKTPSSEINLVKKILENEKLDYYQATINENNYKIEIKRI